MPFSLSIGLIFLSAGIVQGLTGFGSALVAIPLLCLLIDIKQAVPLCSLNGMVITTVLFIQLRKQADLRKVIPLFVGSIPGVFIGATLLKSVDSGLIKTFLGILLIVYSLYSLKATPRKTELHRIWGWVAGFLSGAIGAAFSAGGPPTIIYTTLNGWTKDEIKATICSAFFFSVFLIIFAHALNGLTTRTVITRFIFSCPFVLTGTITGAALYRRLPEKNYLQLIYIFLIIMGVMLIFQPFGG